MNIFKKLFNRQVPEAKIEKRFAGARIGRVLSDWVSSSMDINEQIKYDAESLRNRARQLEQDNPFVQRYLKLCEDNIVGERGYILQSMVKDSPDRLDTQANRIIEAGWEEWSKKGNCDVTGKYSFRQICKLIVRHRKRDGEVFVRLVKGYPNKWKFALQLIPAEMVNMNLSSDLGNGNKIIQGIEVDSWGRPKAYHIGSNSNSMSSAPATYLRFSADEILHIYNPESCVQLRSVSELHNSMVPIHLHNSYTEAELVAAKVGACQGGFFTGNTTLPGTVEDDGTIVMDLEPGTFHQLPNGVSFEKYDPNHPNINFNEFSKSILKQISAGLNISYTSLTGDLTEVNFSSIRQGILDERNNWKNEQSLEINNTVKPIFAAWLEQSLLTTSLVFDDIPNVATPKPLPYSKMNKFLADTWIVKRWDWVDPLKDANAMKLKRDLGWMSDTQICADLGTDYEDTQSQIERDNANRKEELRGSEYIVDNSPNTEESITSNETK